MPYAFNERGVAEKLVEIAGNYKPGMGPAQIVPTKGNGWIFKTPVGGIAAIAGSVAGSADCTPYFIDDAGNLVEHKGANGSASTTVEVFNIFSSPIAGDTFITAKMVHNRPVADAEDCG